MSEIAIQFQNVSKYYPLYHHITGGVKNLLLNFPSAVRSFRKSRFEALKDISFEVRRGETFGIIGRNGTGKSTTLGLIAGVMRPTSGKITVNGRISPLLELGAGFHPELSGRENILLNGVLLGLGRRQVLAKMDDIIDFSELGDFIEQPIRTYSSGMLARLGFSVVAHLDPEILLVDEILAVGDFKFQQKCAQKFEDFRRQGKTIVFVSHDLNAIEKFCDNVVLLKNGRIEEVGNPQSVLSKYKSP
jgi:lipopolysaccharide transport system ATP-binding protein